MLSGKNKRFFLKVTFFVSFFVVVLAAEFLLPTASVLAQTVKEAPSAAEAAGVKSALFKGEPGADNPIAQVFKWILYALIWIFTGLMNVAASIFAWATRPEYISGPTGLLNLEVVYNLWKFIRDFFNLAFIFLLLFSAFGTVFQLQQFNLKKNFFSIIAAALLINFSFPITRIVIDAGNVPMYFFAQGLVGDSQDVANGNAFVDIPRSFMKTSGLSSILLPEKAASSDFYSLITGVIFSFMFMITLLTLAILFIFRLIKLVILLIFSPLGIAASLIPGLEKQGKDWWSNLFQTVFFGPAAMLMLVIALRFMQEINGSSFSQGLADQAGQNAASGERADSIVAQGIFFIPIILMWMAMGVGNKFGIEGAAMVMKQADKALDWGKTAAKKGAYYGSGAGLVKWGAKTGYRKADSKLASTKYGKYLSPGAIKKAFKDRAVAKKHEDEQPIEQAAGDTHDLLNKRISQAKNRGALLLPQSWLGKNAAERRKALKGTHDDYNTDHSEYGIATFVKQGASAAKHLEETSDNWESLITHWDTAVAKNDSQEMAGVLKLITKNNDINDLVPDRGQSIIGQLTKRGESEFKKDSNGQLILEEFDANGKLQQLLKDGQQIEEDLVDQRGDTVGRQRTVNVMGQIMKLYSEVDANGKEKMFSDANSGKAVIATALRQTGAEDKNIRGLMEHLSNQALAANNGSFGNMVERDSHGEFQLTDEDTQAEKNAGKLSLIPAQKQVEGIHADTFFRRGGSGYIGLNGKTAIAVMDKIFTVSYGNNAGRMKNQKEGWKALWEQNDEELAAWYDQAGRDQKYAFAKVMYQAGAWKDDPRDMNAFFDGDGGEKGPQTFAEARRMYP
jgi:hypothetical protein